MHNNIMAQVSRDRPPMLATRTICINGDHGFYDTFDTRPKGEALRNVHLTRILIPPTMVTTNQTVPENKAIHLILTGIGDEIYSTVDACQTAQEMWEAIERLQQGESLNIQDVKTNLFWEFGQFTSHDGETIESYYTRFYKMMNEMIRNNLSVATMQVNVQFLQQLQPEWSRFVTIVKQQHRMQKATVRDTTVSTRQDCCCVNKPEKGVQLQAEQSDWLADTDEEIDEQELRSTYSYMAKDQEVPNADSDTDAEPIGTKCVSKDVMCSYLLTSSDLDEITELQCLYLHKVMECDCLAQKLSAQTDFVSKEIYTELNKRLALDRKNTQFLLDNALQDVKYKLNK
ncbi:hypothetical protein Tco_0091620 [Tanacetum coccineum]